MIADDEYIYKASVDSWTETRTELDYASVDGNEVVSILMLYKV